jgi:hypothetical protein
VLILSNNRLGGPAETLEPLVHLKGLRHLDLEVGLCPAAAAAAAAGGLSQTRRGTPLVENLDSPSRR